MFDFDDTLADTMLGRIATFQATAAQVLGLDLTPEQALDVIRSGSNLEQQMAGLAGGNPDVAKDLLEAYRVRYYHPDREPLALFPGLAAAISDLRSTGVRLALVTSRHRAGANGNPVRGVAWELERMGQSKLFQVIVGYEDSAGHKPAPDPFMVCLERLGLAGEDAVAVGDSPFDIIGARAAGMGTAAALWGAADSAALLNAAPDTVLAAPPDLAMLLRP